MQPSLRRFALATHITFSVGWIGAVAAYAVLDVTVATSNEVANVRAAYLGMDLIARFAILPLALLSFVTGLIMSLGTKWGLFRHYWTVISLILTMVAVAVLLIETQTIHYFASVAADPATPDAALFALGGTLLHSIGGMVVLVVILWLNMYKPRGLTAYGWRRQQKEVGLVTGSSVR